MKRIVSVIAALCIVSPALTSSVKASVPHRIYYQGQLTDEVGAPLDTAINMTFTIYDDSTGGGVWWTETQPGVVVSNGLFSVLLGSAGSPIVDTVFRDDFRWLGVQIASDPEITPRTRLVTVPWAYRVSSLDGATGGHVFGSMHLHSDLVVGGLLQGEPGGLYVTNGDTPFLLVDGTTEQVGIGMIDPNAQFHAEAPADKRYAGSFAGSNPTSDASVLKAEYVGTGSYDARAVYGRCTPADYYGIGGEFEGGWLGAYGHVIASGDEFYVGLRGESFDGSGSNIGVYGRATGSGLNRGVAGEVWDPSATVNYALYGVAAGSEVRYGVYADVDSSSYDFAGYFRGNVQVTGTSTKGGGGFKIDHPLDPTGKYLYHSSVHSPDMKNIYDGVVTLDEKGEASVELPDYFGAVNRDFRYQLTAVGAPAPNLYIADKIADNRFKIAGGQPGMEVSWQVTGIRKDGFAEAYGTQVEVDKPVREQGKYLHPEVYGLGQEYGIHYEQRRQMKEKLQHTKAKSVSR